MVKKGNGSIDIEKVTQATMADIVEIRLREYFKKQALKPGDPLPTELELADALGVSRNVMREALSRLRMLGMIETKKRRGMILGQPDILGSFERVLDPMIIDEATLKDIFEIRLTLEVGLADLLYLRKTKEDIEELEKIALEQNDPNVPHVFRINHEVAFHGKLYRMTGNRTLQRFQSLLLPVFGYIVSLEKELIVGTVSHLDLVNLLKNGSKEDFRQGMLDHMDHHFNKLTSHSL